MKKIIVLLLLLTLLIGHVANAQMGYPAGYEMVYVAPEEGMQSLDYNCAITVYESANGMRQITTTADVDAYIVWKTPVRPAGYYVSFTVSGIRYWTIWSRETLAGQCH